MSKENDASNGDGHGQRHLTTRRGFVSCIGFGVVSLYGLWAAYGVAPLSLSALGGGGGGGHGGMGGGGMSPEEFQELAEAFIEANELPDGSVKPRRMRTAAMNMDMDDMDMTAAEGESAHADGETARVEGEAAHIEDETAHVEDEEAHVEGEAAHVESEADHAEGEAEHDEEAPIDVYIMASRFYFEPSVLRLDVNTPYRLRLMAMDTGHGASINMQAGSHIIRGPARTLLEKEITFTAPGECLVYCTVYCGEGHDMMHAKIIVEAA